MSEIDSQSKEAIEFAIATLCMKFPEEKHSAVREVVESIYFVGVCDGRVAMGREIIALRRMIHSDFPPA